MSYLGQREWARRCTTGSWSGTPSSPTTGTSIPREGGRVLGNLCHWTDFVLRLVPTDTYPIRITPTAARDGRIGIA